MKKTEKEIFDEVFKDLYEDLMPEPPKPKWRSQNERIAQQRWEQYQRELPAIQRQRAIDSVWLRVLEERREQALDSGDPDAKFRDWIWGEARRLERRENARRRQEELEAKALSDVALGDALWQKGKGNE